LFHGTSVFLFGHFGVHFHEGGDVVGFSVELILESVVLHDGSIILLVSFA